MTYATQLRVLLWKNALLTLRNWKLTAMQLGCPVLFILLLFLMGMVPKYGGPIGEQPEVDISRVPMCTPRGDKSQCFSFMFGPANNSAAYEIASLVAAANGFPVYVLNDTDINTTHFQDIPNGAVVGMNSFLELQNFIIRHQNFTQSVLYFNSTQGDGTAPPTDEEYRSGWHVKYELWYNSTCTNPLINPSTDFSSFTSPVPFCPDIRPQLQLAVDCAITEYLLDGATQTVQCKGAAQSYYWVDLGVNDTVQSYGVLFFFCAMMFVFVVLIYQIVFEKDKNLKLGMQLMGLKESVFWITWFITAVTVSFIAVWLVIITGFIFQFDFFFMTNIAVIFITFFLFSLAMIGLSIMIAVIVGSAKQAISMGMLLYILGVLIQIFFQNADFIAFIYQDDMLAANILRPIFLCYPPFSFAKVIQDISAKSYNFGTKKGPGYDWADLSERNYMKSNGEGFSTPPDLWSWYWLLIDCAIYYTLAWYLDNVLPSDTGSGSPPWFFLTPKYWGIKPRGYEVVEGKDELQCGKDAAIQILNVRKIHYKFPFGIRSSSDVLAVDNVNLVIDQGELFCLLGHNGAGKTTTINMLTGLYPPTSGSITIFERDIERDLEEIRSMIGICPQHDILWMEMTPVEHLYLFSR